MEIRTSPHRPATTPWVRLAVLAVVLAPVCAFVLLPVGLGLERYVVSSDSMDGDRPDSIPRGAVVFERPVPVADLRPGDVITFRPPGTADRDLVTHRIVEIGPEGITTRGDANAAPDPWLLRPEGSLVPRVVLTVPWLGYAHLVLTDRLLVLLAGAAALALVVLSAGSRTRRRRTSRPPAVLGTGGQP